MGTTQFVVAGLLPEIAGELQVRRAGPRRRGEFVGIVEDVGADVTSVEPGDLVVSPFAVSDGTCAFCQEGLHTSCAHGACWDGIPDEGGQAEAIRVPLATARSSSCPSPRTPRSCRRS